MTIIDEDWIKVEHGDIGVCYYKKDKDIVVGGNTLAFSNVILAPDTDDFFKCVTELKREMDKLNG